ncbi:MAG: hypothetical protein M1839_008385 [Geoglossum umbratile]|nr:MAG: hypothetical protein M1839_008385 [Geoglossum umbratile]
MEWNEEERRALQEARADPRTELHRAPPKSRLLSPFTVSCLVFNRTIGSGIFSAPLIVYEATRSIGVSLIFWFVGGLISTCGLLVWLELGLTVPKVTKHGQLFRVPRNGGEKNYLEFIYRKFQRVTRSVYGIAFILVGNLSGNAIALGSYFMVAAGGDYDDNRSKVIAVTALTLACLLHGTWRTGGILVNNVLAVLKVMLLLALFILGLCAANRNKFVHVSTASTNFNTHHSFAGKARDAATYGDCLVYILYTYSGYEQPFYVLGDVREAHKKYKSTMLATMAVVVTLFTLVNVAYFCAFVPGEISGTHDIATLFLKNIFGSEAARRVMAGIIAVSIFGNIVVFTFTAARVKQQIAMEGFLPFWRWLQADRSTPVAKLITRMKKDQKPDQDDSAEEKSPIPALALHWFFSCLMVAFTASLTPTKAAGVLINLYSYVLILLVGIFVAGGLLYVRFWRERKTWTKESGFKPWGGPTATIVYGLSCGTFAIFGFLPIRDKISPFATNIEEYAHYVVPVAGWCSLLTGLIYLAGFETYLWKRGEQLVTWRRELIFEKEGEAGHLFYGQTIHVVRRVRGMPADAPEEGESPHIPMTVLQA